MFVDLRHFADQAAAGDRGIPRLDASDHVLMLPNSALLRADKQEVEDHENQQQREDRDKEAPCSSGCGSAARGIGWGFEHGFLPGVGRRFGAHAKARGAYHGYGRLPRQGEGPLTERNQVRGGRMIRVDVPWARSLPSVDLMAASAVAICRPRLSTWPSQRTGPLSAAIGRTKFTLVSTVV